MARPLGSLVFRALCSPSARPIPRGLRAGCEGPNPRPSVAPRHCAQWELVIVVPGAVEFDAPSGAAGAARDGARRRTRREVLQVISDACSQRRPQ